MILSGKRYSARRALALGLVDEVLFAQNFKALTLEYAHRMVTAESQPESRSPRTHWLLDRTVLGRRLVLAMARRKVMARTGGHYPGPERVLEVLGASRKLPRRFGPRFSPTPLLLDLAQKGESFYSRFP